jgi:hypothetical protein
VKEKFMKVLVLGCGPAGLMAAQGVRNAHEEAGLPQSLGVRIISIRRPSPLYGAQYLHQPIPGIECGEPVQVNYRLDGSAEGYRRKVYGPMWDGSVSPEDLAESHPAWDIRATYKRLWDLWASSIIDGRIERYMMNDATQPHSGWDLVINSIPRQSLCAKAEHVFGSTEIWAAGDAPDLGINIGHMFRCQPETVICNGEQSPSWYRKSNIFGHTTVEWPGQLGSVPVGTASRVVKPTYTDCDCWPGVVHVGRYGTWQKGVLSHEAYLAGFSAARGVLEGQRV